MTAILDAYGRRQPPVAPAGTDITAPRRPMREHAARTAAEFTSRFLALLASGDPLRDAALPDHPGGPP